MECKTTRENLEKCGKKQTKCHETPAAVSHGSSEIQPLDKGFIEERKKRKKKNHDTSEEVPEASGVLEPYTSGMLLDYFEERKRHKKKKKNHVTKQEGLTELEESGGLESYNNDLLLGEKLEESTAFSHGSSIRQPSANNDVILSKKIKKKKEKHGGNQEDVSELNYLTGENLDVTIFSQDSSLIQPSDEDCIDKRKKHKKKRKNHVTQQEGFTELEESCVLESYSNDLLLGEKLEESTAFSHGSSIRQPSANNDVILSKKSKKKKKKHEGNQEEVSELNYLRGENLDATIFSQDSSLIQPSDEDCIDKRKKHKKKRKNHVTQQEGFTELEESCVLESYSNDLLLGEKLEESTAFSHGSSIRQPSANNDVILSKKSKKKKHGGNQEDVSELNYLRGENLDATIFSQDSSLIQPSDEDCIDKRKKHKKKRKNHVTQQEGFTELEESCVLESYSNDLLLGEKLEESTAFSHGSSIRQPSANNDVILSKKSKKKKHGGNQEDVSELNYLRGENLDATIFSQDSSLIQPSDEDCIDKRKKHKKKRKNHVTQQEGFTELEESCVLESYSNDLLLGEKLEESTAFSHGSSIRQPSANNDVILSKKKKHEGNQEEVSELNYLRGENLDASIFSQDSSLIQPSDEDCIDNRKKHKRKRKNHVTQQEGFTELEESCVLKSYRNDLLLDDCNSDIQKCLNATKEFLLKDDLPKEHYLEVLELIQEKSTHSKSFQELLSTLNINVNWTVAPTHSVETRITKKPTAEQEKELYLLNRNMKKGKFIPEEDRIIKENWEKFSKEYSIPNPQVFLKLSVDNRLLIKLKEKIKFAQYLGRGLPHRSLHNIYERFRSLYGSKSKQRLTAEDKDLLKKHVELCGNNYSALSYILLKNNNNLGKTARKLTSEYKAKAFGTMEEKEKLLKAVLQVTNSDTFEEVNGKNIDWTKVGQILKCRNYSCKEYWLRKLSAYLCVREPIFKADLNCKILESLMEMNITYSQQVNWAVVSKDVYNLPPSFLWHTFSNLCKRFNLKYLGEQWKESLEVLHELYYKNIKDERFTGQLLPSLKFVDGKLVEIKHSR